MIEEANNALLEVSDCIRTNSGLYMNVFATIPEMIVIEDIAHSLANQCRFGGHLPRFYTVAQHSIECAKNVDNDQDRLAALMHDASEAYLLDIPTPIKRHLSNYKEIESNLMQVIADKFGFEWPLSKSIKKVDSEQLVFEFNHIMMEQPFENDFKILSHEEAKAAFIEMFISLTSK